VQLLVIQRGMIGVGEIFFAGNNSIDDDTVFGLQRNGASY
jgi:hypothetical protein